MAKIANLQEVAVESIRPYERNARIHSPEQVDMIENSIREFGFVSPCLIDKDYNLIAGHGRLMAAKKMGLKTVPCAFVEGLTEEERKAYILADNKLFELGGWNEIAISTEIEEIGIDLNSFGVMDEEIREEKTGSIICPRCGRVLEVF